jgi:hypothetical protein
MSKPTPHKIHNCPYIVYSIILGIHSYSCSLIYQLMNWNFKTAWNMQFNSQMFFCNGVYIIPRFPHLISKFGKHWSFQVNYSKHLGQLSRYNKIIILLKLCFKAFYEFYGEKKIIEFPNPSLKQKANLDLENVYNVFIKLCNVSSEYWHKYWKYSYNCSKITSI